MLLISTISCISAAITGSAWRRHCKFAAGALKEDTFRKLIAKGQPLRAKTENSEKQ